MKSAWLTPANAPNGLARFCVYLPNDEMFFWILQGMLTQMENPEKWENVFGETVEDTIAAMTAANQLNLPLTDCEGTSMAIPVGSVLMFGGATLPGGALWCDGEFYDPAVYPDLFAAIGYAWGQSGDLFAVPDMTDAYPKGVGSEGMLGNGAGSNGPRSVPLLAHTHTVRVGSTPGTANAVIQASGTGTVTTQSTGDANPQIDIEPRRRVFNFIIVAESD